MTAHATWVIYIDWDNNGSIDGVPAPTANETVTTNVLGLRTPLNWKMGRDGARSLSGFMSADIALELNNTTKLYSPDYAAGALFGNLGPGKPVRIRATSGTTRDIFRGFIDDYNINPSEAKKSAEITCVDAFAHVADAVVNTALFQGIRTGEAMVAVLDAIGWPGTGLSSSTFRDIDAGSTTIRHFWLENDTAGQAIKDIVESEGPPAVCYVDGTGKFVFRDRGHRLIDSTSTTVQATFRDTGAETSTDVNFSEPAEYNVGYRDLVNSVSFDVEERAPLGVDTVWQTEDTISVGASASVTLTAQADDPFSDAIAPNATDVQPDGSTDYVLQSGSVASITLTRTSGQSAGITITAGAGGAVLSGLRLRAVAYPVSTPYRVTVEDATSIAAYGKTSWTEGVPKWCGRLDAEAIANKILQFRKNRLPTFSVTVNNGNSNRLGQILDRDISDRVTIIETNTAVSADHFIESIEYNVEQIGYDHRATFFCERVPSGLSPSSSDVLILGNNTAGHRLTTGRLAY